MAERERAFGKTLYTLRSLGPTEGEARLHVDIRRVGSRTRPGGEAAIEPAPELRPHKEQPAAG